MHRGRDLAPSRARAPPWPRSTPRRCSCPAGAGSRARSRAAPSYQLAVLLFCTSSANAPDVRRGAPARRCGRRPPCSRNRVRVLELPGRLHGERRPSAPTARPWADSRSGSTPPSSRPRARGCALPSCRGSSWMRTAYFCAPYTSTCATPPTMESRCAMVVSPYSSSAEIGTSVLVSASVRIGASAGFVFWYDGGRIPCGSCRSVCVIAACTSCAAASMFRSSENCTTICVCPEARRRRHVVDAGDRRELLLERRRHRRRHRRRARAGQDRRDRDRREVDVRQIAHRAAAGTRRCRRTGSRS